MKTLMLITGLFFVSCGMPFPFNLMGYEILHEDLSSAWLFVAKPNHKYMEGISFPSPKEFEARGGGDCTGFADDLIYYLGPDANLIIAKMYFNDPNEFHALVEYHGQYLEPQINNYYYYDYDGAILYVEETIDYYTLMKNITNYGTKNIINKYNKYKFK
jgi:hypothetical protein